jgi:hypothetical protein
MSKAVTYHMPPKESYPSVEMYECDKFHIEFLKEIHDTLKEVKQGSNVVTLILSEDSLIYTKPVEHEHNDK